MSTPSLQTFITDASQVLNLSSISAVRSVVAVALANANAGTPLNPNLTTQQLWNEFYQVVTEPKSNIESFIANQMMKFFFSPPAPGGVGADKQVIFNDMGVLAGDAGLVYNKTTDALTVAGLVTAGSATISGNILAGTTNNFASSRLCVQGTAGTATPDVTIGIPVNASGNTNLAIGRSASTGGYIFLDAFKAGLGGTELVLNHLNNGTVLIGTSTVVPAGGCLQLRSGITFPATLALSSNAKTLDDYEEGAWVPSVSGQVNLTSTTLVSAIYTKIGRVVTVSGSVTTSITASNTLAYFALQNLPFTAATTVPGPLWNDSRNTSGTTQVAGTILYGYLPAASGTTTGSVMTIYFSNTYTV